MAAVRKLRLASSLMVITTQAVLAREVGGRTVTNYRGPGPTILHMFLIFS
jgi:hypothetical protein